MKNLVFKMMLLAALFPLMAWAGEVSEEEARQQAQTFLAQRGRHSSVVSKMRVASRGRRVKSATLSPSPSYYIFNVGDDNGFVIVSGDDRTDTILGYADEGSLTETDMPEALEFWLQGYAEQIAWLDSHPQAKKVAKKAAARKAIAPLIQTLWDQGTPYNNYCPEVNGKKAPTGCVATTMAQIMYYHKYPTASCSTIPAYTTQTKKIEVSALEPTTFSWNDMTMTYSDASNATAKDAVAKLMQYCGAALMMDYKESVSSAYNASIAYVLTNYFDYDSSAHYTYRRHYSYAEWLALVYNELAAHRPVVMGGQSAGGGHSFICDGYDTDDYFHFNWGWGGSSNGYFRLSLMSPYEQGVGGSSTLDGFNYTVDAVVGIQPPQGGTSKRYCLFMDKLCFASPNNASSQQTFIRDDTSGDFTGISLSAVFGCFRHGSASVYDYALQLVDGNGELKHTLYTGETLELQFNRMANLSPDAISIPSTVPDGTYYIKVMSRPHGSEDWLECYDGELFQPTAVISGNDLYITVPRPDLTLPTIESVSVNGNKKVGYEQEVIVTFTGGTNDFSGDVILLVNDKTVMGKTLDIPAGQSVQTHFAYTPSTAGDNMLTFKTIQSSYIQIGTSTTVTIDADGATNSQELTISPTITNVSGGKLYGNALRVTVNVANSSAENDYAGYLNCSLRMYYNAEDDVSNYYGADVKTKYITIEKGGSTDITFAYGGIDPTRFYRLRFSYVKSGKTEGGPITDMVGMGEGYAVYTAGGSTEPYPKSESVEVGSAVCVDLTSFGSFDGVTLTPSSNPNCLYLLADGASIPSALTGKNVVRNNVAEAITLVDGNDFYSPVAFTANAISYSRTFTRAANGTSGWNTICLPFAPSSVTCEGLGTVDWFHSNGDTGKNFWLKAFTGDAAGTVYFDFASEMEANTPYIIAVPDDRWGTAWQMTERTVTFTASDVKVAATDTMNVSGDSYKFCGSTFACSLKDAFVLNNDGSSFVNTTTAEEGAFRAWFKAANILSLNLPALSISSGKPTAIQETKGPEPYDLPVYDLLGRKTKLVKPGLYIAKSKKLLVP